MKIFQVLNHFLPQTVAGTEIYVWALSKELQALGHDVEVVIPNYGQIQSVNYFHDGLSIYKYAENSVIDRALVMGRKVPEGLVAFTEYLRHEKPDVVHFHTPTGSNGIRLQHLEAAKDLGAKVFFTFHLAGSSCKTDTLLFDGKIQCDGKIDIAKCGKCYLHSKGYNNLGGLLNSISLALFFFGINSTKWNSKAGTALGTSFLISKQKKDFDLLINYCDKVITLTKWYRNILFLNGVSSKKVVLIEQGLPAKVMLGQDEQIEMEEKYLRLIFVGRVSSFKGLHLLIDVMMQLPLHLVRLDIYGQNDGTNYEQLLKKKSREFSNIRWLGKIERDEVIVKMKKNDVLCLCSTFSEMSPLVIQEAFAAGIPVLASNVYGNAEQVIPNENGWLFNFNDIESLKMKIQYIIDNPKDVFKLKEKLQKNETTSFHIIGENHERLYKNSINEIP